MPVALAVSEGLAVDAPLAVCDGDTTWLADCEIVEAPVLLEVCSCVGLLAPLSEPLALGVRVMLKVAGGEREDVPEEVADWLNEPDIEAVTLVVGACDKVGV